MDSKAIIDATKYTLFLAAGGLIYGFEKVPELPGFPPALLMLMLGLFAASTLFAAILLRVAAKATHLAPIEDGTEQAAHLSPRVHRNVQRRLNVLSGLHSGLLLAGMLILTGTMTINAAAEMTRPDGSPDDLPVSCFASDTYA